MNYQKLLDQIAEDEGRRYTAYLCTKNYWTVGIGRNLETNGLSADESFLIFGEVVSKEEAIERLKTQSLTELQVEVLLQNDVAEVEESCHRNIDMGIHNDARKAVFINMAFQMGIGGLLGFENTLAYAEQEDYELCADEMLDSEWYRRDTPNRALKMSEQMRTGEWQ